MEALRGSAEAGGATEVGADAEAAALFEQSSIDEAVVDCSAEVARTGSPARVAERLRGIVREAAGLTCSIGIATGKVTAKIACETRKPEGLTVVEPGAEAAFLAPLPVSRIPGIGPKTSAALAGSGVVTIGALAAADPGLVRRLLGRAAPYFVRIARGEDASRPAGGWEAKSISEEHTFDEDVEDRSVVARVLEGMAERLARDLAPRGLVARNVTIKVRFEGFDTRTVSKTLPSPVRDVKTITRAARGLLGRLSSDQRRVRLAGLRLSGLRRQAVPRRLPDWPEPLAGSPPVGPPAARSEKEGWRF
jgi:nucleotidyltransferase/DNA polymerase involved in DNA repair